MKQIWMMAGFFFTLGAACWLGDARAAEIASGEVLAGDDAAGNFSAATPLMQLSYRNAIWLRPTAALRSDPFYRNFIARFSVSEAIEDKPAPILRLALTTRVGVQMGLDGQRPALAYRFSDNAVMRLRGSSHGARLVLHWKY